MNKKGMTVGLVLGIYVGGVCLFMLASNLKAKQKADRVEKGWVEPVEDFNERLSTSSLN